MLEFLPQEVRDGLEAARKRDLKKKSRLRIRVNEEVFPVLKFWETGFSLDVARAPHLRGLVDLYDGTRHLYQCLIVASEEEDGQMKYEFKRKAEAHDNVPLDFAREDNAPVGLITKEA
ncbi:hypothetical protein SAMN04488527_104110 [Aliiroseovarius crassostreae]|uniref:Uncharacterized protein n=1 Tax=Aliiroseovarius crassostreae TaxID=154981 RepID=A0A0P7I415_9RHOB|nr:hypothetical protein [Aliiroseovarius crassostreae]KPN63970.1 hypothetical protein AKJ29_14965 [Aliiroseovarius crassostreae]UWP89305.1 hypothetical protein K3J57_00910 [Aliiroseovarius crassostreae]SFU50636.1 hypothetical protein SAMN04488527_104110 [Aliiroseovarius crassostreae]